MEMRGRIDKIETWAPAKNDKNVKINESRRTGQALGINRDRTHRADSHGRTTTK